IPSALGFVTTRDLEDRRVLHITNAPEPKNAIQGTAVHEYFHHAQSRTKEAGKTNLIDTAHAADWVIEGLARWFEDDLFDSLDTYTLKEDQPLPRVLETGVGALVDKRDARTRAYARFAFWKMVQMKCSGFSIPQILNVDIAGDPRGVANFRARVESSLWQCDFGGGLGDANRATLPNALLEYTFATVKNDDISLLDSNEPNFDFRGDDELFHVAPKTDCVPEAPCAGAAVTGTIAPAGASAFVLDAVLDPPEGAISTLWITTTPAGGEAFLWAGDAEQLMSSPSAGKWAAATKGGTVAYGVAGRSPKALAVIVNPSPTAPVTVNVRAGYGPPPRLSLGNSTYTLLCSVGTCTGEWCGVKPSDNGPTWIGPLTWTGNSFAFDASGSHITGELSADRKTLISFKYAFGGATWLQWANLPLDVARSTPDQPVFAASGLAAADHILVADPFLCDNHSGIDYGKPVLIEIWLGP
ncbi:MAG TPA: hypothetical protein VLJ18_04205, partial [Thermoanaerobaculia bacterium]|nr:hypothetical protein [Thermoanaerobaculia bacterium]